MKVELANKLFTSESIGDDNNHNNDNNDNQVTRGYKVGGDYIKPFFLILYFFLFSFPSIVILISIE